MSRLTIAATLIVSLMALACADGAPPPPATTSAPAATTPTATPDAPVEQTAELGRPAPDFTLTDVTGGTVSLVNFKGKAVVLEWTNPNCPFVKRHYNNDYIPSLTRFAAEKGVAWITIQSSRPDHQQYATPQDLAAAIKNWKAAPAAILMDPDGRVGRLYDAKTTPHLYLIDSAGLLVYNGAIDSDPSGNEPAPTRHFRNALDDLLAGRPVALGATQAYGCGVKY